MDNLDGPSTQLSATARPACRRRRVVGIDLWVERSCGEGQPLTVARSAARATHLRLVAALKEGLDETACSAGEDDVLRLRFAARRDDVHVTDEAIWELLTRLPASLRWSRLAKLEEFDAIPDFPPLPAL
ncbi:MAG: hypothetical protein ACYCTE_15265 [Acidimicrobiales bacterium]